MVPTKKNPTNSNRQKEGVGKSTCTPKKEAGGREASMDNGDSDVETHHCLNQSFESGKRVGGAAAMELVLPRATQLEAALQSEPRGNVSADGKGKRLSFGTCDMAGAELKQSFSPLTDRPNSHKGAQPWHWGKCEFPLDFKMCGSTDSEETAMKLYNTQDAWAFRDEVAPVRIRDLYSAIVRKSAIDTWRPQFAPHVYGRLIPFAKDIASSGFRRNCHGANGMKVRRCI